MTTELDRLYAALLQGGDAEGMAFYRALADAELFILLEEEPQGETLDPQVFDLEDGPVLLVFDTEERMAGFAEAPMPYAALPGRVIAAQMAGQGLAMGLNLGSDAASEVILPPEALAWMMQMLDQAPPQALQARLSAVEPPKVPDAVLNGLAQVLAGVPGVRGHLVAAVYSGGRRTTLLVLTGVAAGAEVKLTRAVTEMLAFSGLDAGEIDVIFATEGDAILSRIRGVALEFQADLPPEPAPFAPTAPGLDPSRPPKLR